MPFVYRDVGVIQDPYDVSDADHFLQLRTPVQCRAVKGCVPVKGKFVIEYKHLSQTAPAASILACLGMFSQQHPIQQEV
jgi:hypothetical protein